MYKKIAFIVLVILGLAVLVAWFSRTQEKLEPVSAEKISVAASFYPLAYMAEQVGGNQVEVFSVVPNGVEPHDFEPTAQDIIRLRQAKVFMYNGNGFEPWVENLRADLESAGVKMIAASQAVSALKVIQGEENDHGEFDPHIWLDPVAAGRIAELIRDTLIVVDPAGAEVYHANTVATTGSLNMLHAQYNQQLASCSNRQIVVSHDAFNYLAARYNFIIHSIAGLSPEAEPSPKHLAELTKLVKEKQIKTIFFETLVSPRLAETLAKETGATTAVLNPIEGLTSDEITAEKNYETIMRDNLNALTTAMVCQ